MVQKPKANSLSSEINILFHFIFQKSVSFDADFFVETSPLWRLKGFLGFGFLVVDSQWSVSESMVNSHRVTTVSRQAVECEARNPCIHDHDNIKNAEGTTEGFFCRTFGALIFFAILFCRDSALRASSPAWKLSSLQDFFCCEQRALSYEHLCSQLMAHSS